jgi:hypothetical protein
LILTVLVLFKSSSGLSMSIQMQAITKQYANILHQISILTTVQPFQAGF